MFRALGSISDLEYAECTESRKMLDRFLIHTLELKLWHFEVYPICLYVEAMHLQCFPPTCYVCVCYLETSLTIARYLLADGMTLAILCGFQRGWLWCY